MLVWKKSELEQTVTTPRSDGALADYHATLLPERTSDELLADLRGLAALHKQKRVGTIGIYVAGLILSFGTIIGALTAFTSSPHHGSWTSFYLTLIAGVAFVIPGTFGAIGFGRAFYKAQQERLATTIPALVQREEMRALPILLEIMDMKASGILMWKGSRAVFLQAMETLLARITPDQFQELSRSQMWDIAMLLYFPDGRLREVTAEALVRCGDIRTLEALKRLQRLSALGVATAKTPAASWNPMLWYLRREGVPLPAAEAQASIDGAIVGLTEEVDGAWRTAQLLRPSDRDRLPDGRELVRAAVSPGPATAGKQLVRPSDVGSED